MDLCRVPPTGDPRGLGFQKLGVKQGDHVLVWGPAGREHTLIFFGLSYIGAVYVPINTAYRGNLLAHVINVSDASWQWFTPSFVRV